MEFYEVIGENSTYCTVLYVWKVIILEAWNIHNNRKPMLRLHIVV